MIVEGSASYLLRQLLGAAELLVGRREVSGREVTDRGYVQHHRLDAVGQLAGQRLLGLFQGLTGSALDEANDLGAPPGERVGLHQRDRPLVDRLVVLTEDAGVRRARDDVALQDEAGPELELQNLTAGGVGHPGAELQRGAKGTLCEVEG